MDLQWCLRLASNKFDSKFALSKKITLVFDTQDVSHIKIWIKSDDCNIVKLFTQKPIKTEIKQNVSFFLEKICFAISNDLNPRAIYVKNIDAVIATIPLLEEINVSGQYMIRTQNHFTINISQRIHKDHQKN